MQKKIAKIESTMLGREDHGILTSFLYVTYGGSGQGIGGYSFDEHNPLKLGTDERKANAYGMEFIARTLRAVNVSMWEKLVGKTFYVLTEDDSWGSKVLGIEGLPTEGGYTFIFDDLAREMGLK